MRVYKQNFTGLLLLLNYGKRFGKRGRIVQWLMVKADLWLLERRGVAGGGGKGVEGFESSSGRPAVHQTETSS